MNLNLIIELLVILLLLAASALISGAEVAFFSIGPNERDQLKIKNSRKAKNILALLGVPEDLLATLLVSNNLINIGIIILSTWITDSLLTFPDHPVLKFVIQVVVITFVLLLIGEVLPKIYATRHSLRLAQVMSLPVTTLERILRPVNRVLIGSTSLVRKRLKDQSPPLTMDELSEALVLTGPELIEEKKILKGIVSFGNIEVGEIMKPRVDIYSLDIKEPFRVILDRMIEYGYSRFPVYQNNLDDIRGIIYVKDLLSHIQETNSFRWQSLIRPAFFVPENKHINDLLQEFRQNKMHMAIVVDEYGGTSGLITMEDILEEIVGEISDESDEEDLLVQKLGEKLFLCNGKISLHDLIKKLDLEETCFDEIKGGSETLAGLILEIRGEIPETGEKIHLNNLTFVIRSHDDRRIKEIEIEIE
ncbi:MAG: gliding motility-associated protein GldE [Bacteroidales bacterium]|nr:gliding motility-associated protein GldE [Bacteroidales bacterium]